MLLLAGCASGGPDEAAPAREALAVRHVGDEACASCHEDLYLSYHRTGMGRSVSRFEAAAAPERFGPEARVFDARRKFYYEPFVRGDTLFQREFRLDAAGRVVYEQTHPAAWVIGSGHATRSYLMQVNGYVTEMPLTWYVERGRWDLSPAYEQTNHRFDRPIVLECMTCHNGLPTFTPFTLDHYADVPTGITCERCHGAGGAHVEARLAGLDPAAGRPDTTIVHPARLDRDLQLSICQQCHLSGITVFAPGQDATTFRPGTPLAAHRSVFALEAERDDPERFGIASHAKRLALSACYRRSAMTCTTCHDPHRPVAELGAAHFNQVCQGCHTPAPEQEAAVCSRPDAHGRAEAMTGNCIGCHLQRSGTSDIPHVTFTDHWIRRTLPPARRPEDIERMLVRAEPLELVRVTEAPPAEDAQARLEEAVAYWNLYETKHRLPAYLPRVVRLARRGLAAGADHPAARLALGRALLEADSLAQAEQVLEAAAARYPDDAFLAYWLGEARLRAGRAEAALAPLQRAGALQPLFVEARLKLAAAYEATGRVEAARAAYRAALDLDPVHHPQAWNNLGFLYLQQQRVAEAGPLFERAVGLDPDLVVALVNLGSVRLIEQAFEAAAALFERALEADPDNVAALGNLGLVYAHLERYEEARVLLRRVLRLTPGDQRAEAALAQVEQRLRGTR